jgi:hypothetical protein
MMEKTCQHCGSVFSVTVEQKARKFCSHACKVKSQTKARPVACPGCGVVKVRALADPHVYCFKCGHKNRAAERVGQPVTHGPEWLASVKSKARREKLSKSRNGWVCKTALTKKGSPHHPKAADFFVRSPSNVVYWVRNIAEFVRRNPGLFHPDDIVNNSKKRATYSCKATAGLCSLIRTVETRGSWKGWQLVSRVEYKERFDLIGRNSACTFPTSNEAEKMHMVKESGETHILVNPEPLNQNVQTTGFVNR